MQPINKLGLSLNCYSSGGPFLWKLESDTLAKHNLLRVYV